MEEDEFEDPFKKKRKFTKEDAIYGVFAGDEYEEEPRERKKYSKPMGFVSSASKDEEEVDEMDYRPTMSFKSFGGEKPKKSTNSRNNNVPSTASRKDTSNIPMPDYGIGAKLLQKQGWKPGEGLGKEKKGMDKPIEVKLRPKSQGLGFGGDERTQQQIERDEGPSEVEPAKKGVRAEGWKRKAKKREKKTYSLPTTVGLPQQKVTITDMRGEQPKVLYDLSGVNEEQMNVDFLPELQHNISLLVNQKEGELLTLDRKKVSELEYIKKLNEDKKALQSTVQAEADKIHRLEEIEQIIAKANEKIQSRSLSLESLAKIFKLFQEKFPEEYKELQLYSLASALAAPLLSDELKSWKPLEEPSFAIGALKSWKDLTQGKPPAEFGDLEVYDSDVPDVYTHLICDLILPKFRSVLLNEWNVKSPEACLILLEAWEPLLPNGVWENILDQLVLPKITRAVEEWNPRQDTIPIHQWIHPWLSLLGSQRLDPLYPVIRQKLSSVLREWDPADVSAHVVLSPWKNVFDGKGMENLLRRSIFPKLSSFLLRVPIDPSNQDLRPFKAALIWEDIFPTYMMLELLEESFFPQWTQALYSWLSQQPNLEEVSQWYLGWKQQFSPSLRQLDRVILHFNHALNVMNSVISGKPPPPPPTLPPIPKPGDRPPVPPKPKQMTREIDEMSFKEIVEQFAESNGFLLIPSARSHEGQKIYTFGNIPIILAKDVVYRQEKNQWIPTALEDLLNQKIES